MFEMYTKLGITFSTDRPKAIFGLEKRLSRTLNGTSSYGILGRHLHRSLLWQRSGEKELTRIRFPTNQSVPSWSWMAYDGAISYMNIPFDRVEWSNAIQWPSISELQNSPDHSGQSHDTPSSELSAIVRDFSLDECAKGRLVFDEHDRTETQGLKCFVIGKETRADGLSDKRLHYVVVVKPICSKERTYERVGVGSIPKECILFEEQELMARII